MRGDSEESEEKLLEAVQSDLGDDCRLVYADWLDQHGDPRKAEYVRLHRLTPVEVNHATHDASRYRLEAGSPSVWL